MNQSIFRRIIALPVVVFCLCYWAALPSPVRAQTADDVFAKVEAALKAADASLLSPYFNTTLEVTVAEKGQDYSKTQAQFVVKEFFQSYPVRSFAFAHRGNSGTTFYAVGKYVSARGTFDVNVFVKKYGSTFLIDQIRFERDN